MKANLDALERLAGLGSAYCSKNLPKEPGTGQMTTEMPIFSSRRAVMMQRVRGFGDAGASPFTMKAAQALDEHLTTNGCAGCNDMTSTLRQLTFAFKAAYLTDTGITPQINLNMSSALAMTAFGQGTNQALSLVLGASRTYDGGVCTDDSGMCLGVFATPVIPPGVKAIEQALANQIVAAIKQAGFIPQPELVSGLMAAFATLINRIGYELAKLRGEQVVPVAVVTATPTTTKEGWTTTEKVLAGGAIGVAVAGVGLLLYYAGKRKRS